MFATPRFPVAALIIGLVLSSPNLVPAREHVHYGEGFSIDLNQPYGEVVTVVQQISQDGTIRGTSDYKGSHELDGAESVTSSKALPAVAGGGKTFYKVRTNTVAPEHFYESTDAGTVVVRYMVKQLSPTQTRLRIDAVFEQDSHRHTLPSDGHVENNEFEAISDIIRDLADKAEEQRRKEAVEQQQKKLDHIQAQLDQETALLKAANLEEQNLHAQLRHAKGGPPAQVKAGGVDLKAAPYNQATTVQALTSGETVTIQLQTPSWYLVETAKGDRGWVYRLNLETTP